MPSDARILPFRDPQDAAKNAVFLSNLTLTHRGQRLLHDTSAQIAADGITGLLGPNGAGKSILLRVIAGLINADTGSVDISAPFNLPALVFQRPVLLRRTVRANLIHALKVAGVPRAQRTGKLAELLVAGDLSRLAENPARSLSGGEQQRLAIVRALAADPKLLLLDEPTASLDPAATLAIEKLIKTTAARGVKIIFVTHDRVQAARLCSDVLFLHKGAITEHTPTDAFFAAPTSRAAQAYLAGDLLL